MTLYTPQLKNKDMASLEQFKTQNIITRKHHVDHWPDCQNWVQIHNPSAKESIGYKQLIFRLPQAMIFPIFTLKTINFCNRVSNSVKFSAKRTFFASFSFNFNKILILEHKHSLFLYSHPDLGQRGADNCGLEPI